MTMPHRNRPSTTGAPRGRAPAHDYQIHLNFLPVAGTMPEFVVYRRLQDTPQEARPHEDSLAFRLPSEPDDTENWPSYWVSMDEQAGFEGFRSSPSVNLDLTRRILSWSLKSAAHDRCTPDKYWLPPNPFRHEVAFIQREYDEGHEEIVVQPYHLRSTQQFGYLVDFHFKKRDGVPFSRRVQQLSLSLDRNYRRNLDCYVDRLAKIVAFLEEPHDILGGMPLPGTAETFTVETDFVALPADRLKTKVYVFGGNHEAKSQFTGLRDYGPLKPLQAPPKLLFVFREQDRIAARRLAVSLRGVQSRGRFTFPGFQALFKCEPVIDSNPAVLPDLTQASIEGALQRAQQADDGDAAIIPVLILPEQDDSYLIQKSLFSHAEIATQVCTLPIIRDENALKWAIANIALQVFCKAGGYPWKVRPTGERSLIIGISQSHKLRTVEGQRTVEKYFAFSVLTDSSGLFQTIQVLGQGENQDSYLDTLRRSLRDVLVKGAQEFDRVVIHTSFKLKRREIDAIQGTVRETAESDSSSCRFAVVKVNHKSRFFGINRDVNSLVPYEATRVRLGPREYLVWFEGIFPDKTTVNKAFPGPTHLQILRVSDENRISDEVLLQDLVNLSGANWRGFNAKSTPVSVFYCHLVADLVHDFHERNLPLPAVKDIRPWFL